MIALIDGDILAHNACPTRYETKDDTIYHRYNSEGQRIAPVFDKAADRKHMEYCWRSFERLLDELLSSLFIKEYMMAVKSPTNFRDDLYWDYKGQRKNKPNQNMFVPAIRELAVMQGLAVEATGREADDLIRIWAEQAMKAGDPFVICTIDKDMKCIPGKYYNIKEKELSRITEQFAVRFFYEQLLKGDPVDKIPGVPGIGDVKAKALLEPFNTEEEFQEVVVDSYMRAFGDKWFDYLLINGKLLYLQKSEDDYFKCRDWTICKEIL
jgi:5'-3' exonuclease